MKIRKYVDQMNPTLEDGISKVREYACKEIKNTPQMKDEIERCQCQAVSKFVEEFSGKLQSEKIEDDLSDYQIENWRTTLLLMGFGPYALIMPEEDIIKFKNILQDIINPQDTQEVFGFLNEN
jgi:hypothetical protein